MKFSGPEMLWGITTDINAIKKLSAHDLVKDNTKLKCISIKKFNKHFLWFAGYLQEDYERIWFLFWLLLRNFSWRGFNGVIGWKNWRLQKGKSLSCLPSDGMGYYWVHTIMIFITLEEKKILPIPWNFSGDFAELDERLKSIIEKSQDKVPNGCHLAHICLFSWKWCHPCHQRSHCTMG